MVPMQSREEGLGGGGTGDKSIDSGYSDERALGSLSAKKSSFATEATDDWGDDDGWGDDDDDGWGNDMDDIPLDGSPKTSRVVPMSAEEARQSARFNRNR